MSKESLPNSTKRFFRDTNRWSIILLAIGLLIGAPIFFIGFQLFAGAGEMWQHLVDYLLWDYLSNSFSLALGCSFLTIFIGVSCAWIVSRYDFPFRKKLDWILFLPLTIPSYITAYAYTGIFDNGGSLTVLLKDVGIHFPKIDFMNIYGLIWVLSLSLFPYVYVSVRVAFLQQSKKLMDASFLLGASERKYFFTIALPLARPAIVGGVVLVLMEVLNDYGAAKYYNVPTFTTGIFRTWGELQDLPTAIYLSAILVTLIFLLLFFEKWQRGKRGFEEPSNQKTTVHRIKLKGAKRNVVLVFISIPILFGFILPVAQLLFWAWLTYAEMLEVEFIWLILESFGIALLAALLTTLFAILVIYLLKWNRLKNLQVISKTSILGYAIPGAIIGIGVMVFGQFFVDFFFENYDLKIGHWIYGSILLLIYAYIVRFLAIAYSPIEANTLKTGNYLAESAHLLGESRIKTFFKVEFPLLKTGIVSAIILVFIDILKELPLTLILKPYTVQTLAIKAYENAENGEVEKAALPALLIIFTAIVFIFLLNKMKK
jgi:iron(III) transport system permease protein